MLFLFGPLYQTSWYGTQTVSMGFGAMLLCYMLSIFHLFLQISFYTSPTFFLCPGILINGLLCLFSVCSFFSDWRLCQENGSFDDYEVSIFFVSFSLMGYSMLTVFFYQRHSSQQQDLSLLLSSLSSGCFLSLPFQTEGGNSATSSCRILCYVFLIFVIFNLVHTLIIVHFKILLYISIFIFPDCA